METYRRIMFLLMAATATIFLIVQLMDMGEGGLVILMGAGLVLSLVAVYVMLKDLTGEDEA